jgi:hypothetical protein
VEISILLLSPSQWTFSNSTPLLCVIFSSLFIQFSFVVFFFCGGGSVCPGGYAGLTQG